ncbi:MAG: hypothetical protein OXG66_04085 [Acidimicrobiaceae bacterium]|nr:hypothetical protein [Acidimicrobiaceae bacterium]
MLVGVDHARQHQQPGGIHNLLAGRGLQLSDLGDPPSGDAQIYVLQLPVVGVEGHQMSDVAQEEAGHGRQSAPYALGPREARLDG